MQDRARRLIAEGRREEAEAIAGPNLREPPELFPDLASVWAAFNELSTDRPLGFGFAGPLPHSTIEAYADRAGMEADERDTFRYLIRALDTEYLKHVNAKRE